MCRWTFRRMWTNIILYYNLCHYRSLPHVSRSRIARSCYQPVARTLANFLGSCLMLRHVFEYPFLAFLVWWTWDSLLSKHPKWCQFFSLFSAELWCKVETPVWHILGRFWHWLASTCWLLQHHPIWWHRLVRFFTQCTERFKTFCKIILRPKPEFSKLRQRWWVCVILVSEEIV